MVLGLVVAIASGGCGTAAPPPGGWTSVPGSAAPEDRASAASSPDPASSASPVATATPPMPTPDLATAGWRTVRSERHGWALSIPAAWIHRPAVEDWPLGTYPIGGEPYIDQFLDPAGGLPFIDVATQPRDGARAVEEFLAWLDAENSAHGFEVVAAEMVLVDGVVARIQQQRLGYNVWEVAIIDEERVILVYWIGASDRVEAERPLIDRVLAGFRRR